MKNREAMLELVSCALAAAKPRIVFEDEPLTRDWTSFDDAEVGPQAARGIIRGWDEFNVQVGKSPGGSGYVNWEVRRGAKKSAGEPLVRFASRERAAIQAMAEEFKDGADPEAKERDAKAHPFQILMARAKSFEARRKRETAGRAAEDEAAARLERRADRKLTPSASRDPERHKAWLAIKAGENFMLESAPHGYMDVSSTTREKAMERFRHADSVLLSVEVTEKAWTDKPKNPGWQFVWLKFARPGDKAQRWMFVMEAPPLQTLVDAEAAEASARKVSTPKKPLKDRTDVL